MHGRCLFDPFTVRSVVYLINDSIYEKILWIILDKHVKFIFIDQYHLGGPALHFTLLKSAPAGSTVYSNWKETECMYGWYSSLTELNLLQKLIGHRYAANDDFQ